MAIKKILVTGANGQLGWELSQLTDIYPAFGKHLNPITTDFNSVSELEKFVVDKKITSIRIGFNI